MPQILPLRGLRYTGAAGPLSDLLAPPYDVISPRQQKELQDKSPYNAVHLELASDSADKYATVASKLGSWLDDGALARDEEHTLYIYEQEFTYGGETFKRKALIVGVEAQPWEEGAVHPHEFTMSGPKEDRLKLLQATKTQFSPTFMIARDRAGQLRQFLHELSAGEPDHQGTSIDGDTHRLWLVTADSFMLRRIAPLLSESFYIADGHHRYETAVNYRNWVSEQEGSLAKDHPARFNMAAVVPMEDPGLVIRPIYRWLPKRPEGDWKARLADVFDVSGVAGGAGQALLGALEASPNTFVAIGLEGGAVHQLTPKAGFDFGSLPGNSNSAEWAAVAPNLLRLAVLNPLWNLTDEDLRSGLVEYLHDIDEVHEKLEKDGGVAILLKPVAVKDVIDLADKGERMPQKSTFFHPKLGTGLVFNPLYS